jgi:hypothetical protein
MIGESVKFVRGSGEVLLRVRLSGLLLGTNNLTKKSLPNLTVYQKGVYCMGIRVYNILPFHIKEESYNHSKFEGV